MPPPTLAIVGRPNVGKSTLFNRLVGRKLAIVDDTPGVTRDRKEGEGRIADLAFRVIDTAGLEEAFDDSLEARMRQQTNRALDDADLVLMVIDARAGVTPIDEHFADWLRGLDRTVILLANKCEGREAEAARHEAWKLGLGEPVAFSAEHGLGIDALYDALREALPGSWDAEADEGDAVSGGSADRRVTPLPIVEDPAPLDPDEDQDVDDDAMPDAAELAELAAEDEEVDDRVIQLAIVGRPNVGKSTLVNALLGEDRVLTGPEPGVTRDAIHVDWAYDGRAIRLVDTAGMRRKARIDKRLEKLSVQDTLSAIRLAQVVVLLLDASAILDKQDLTIARLVIDEGRALVVAINKWDAIDDRQGALTRLSDRLQTSLSQVKGVPTVTLSALKGQGLDKLLDRVLGTYDVWNSRVTTGQLNRWLETMTTSHPPPMVQGRRLKLRYMTQVKARPPTFAIWTSRPADLPEDYQRYLINGLRERFGIKGVPIRILLRKPKNPYAGRR